MCRLPHQTPQQNIQQMFDFFQLTPLDPSWGPKHDLIEDWDIETIWRELGQTKKNLSLILSFPCTIVISSSSASQSTMVQYDMAIIAP